MSTQTNIINEIKTKILQKFPALYIAVMESEYDGEIEFLINNKNIFNSKEFKELAWHLYVEYNNKLENGLALILDEDLPNLIIETQVTTKILNAQILTGIILVSTINVSSFSQKTMPIHNTRIVSKDNNSFSLNLPLVA